MARFHSQHVLANGFRFLWLIEEAIQLDFGESGLDTFRRNRFQFEFHRPSLTVPAFSGAGSEKQIPRRPKPPRDGKNKELSGTTEVVPSPRLLALPTSACTSHVCLHFPRLLQPAFFCSREGMPFQTSGKPESQIFNENSTTGSLPMQFRKLLRRSNKRKSVHSGA